MVKQTSGRDKVIWPRVEVMIFADGKKPAEVQEIRANCSIWRVKPAIDYAGNFRIAASIAGEDVKLPALSQEYGA